MTRGYPAEIECDADGRFVVTFPDFGWGATDGATREGALAEARDLLRELIAATIREGEALPASSASKDRPLVVPQTQASLDCMPTAEMSRSSSRAARMPSRRSISIRVSTTISRGKRGSSTSSVTV